MSNRIGRQAVAWRPMQKLRSAMRSSDAADSLLQAVQPLTLQNSNARPPGVATIDESLVVCSPALQSKPSAFSTPAGFKASGMSNWQERMAPPLRVSTRWKPLFVLRSSPIPPSEVGMKPVQPLSCVTVAACSVPAWAGVEDATAIPARPMIAAADPRYVFVICFPQTR